MTNAWFYYAFSAAVLWGLSYALSDRLLQQGVSVSLLMLIEAVLIIPTVFVLSLKLSPMEGVSVLFSNYKVMLMALVVALAAVVGTALIFLGISEKNATLVSLIEISYPIFVFIFSLLFFKDMQLTVGTAVGSVLIFAGIAIIYLKG